MSAPLAGVRCHHGILRRHCEACDLADRLDMAEQHIEALQVERREIEALVQALVIDANRLCDRQLGGTYGEDCRRSLARVKALMKWS
jgi:hypothetical protein